MATALSDFIANATVIDTHEHMRKEPEWLEQGPDDVLQDLFDNYAPADLISAGADRAAVNRLTNGKDQDVEGRWSAVRDAWDSIRHTGYAEGVRLCAQHVYGIDEITPQALRAVQPKLKTMRQPGQRLRILRDLAKLDHIQTDNGMRAQRPDESGPDFFLYDISWLGFTFRGVDWTVLESETGVTVKNLATLRQSMEAVFERFGAYAIAIKTQHA
jgi:uncharacterized protein